MFARLVAPFFLAVMVFSHAPLPAYAATDMTATPAVMDEKAKARDILKKEITIKNTSSRKLTVYPIVKDVVSETGATGFVQAQDSTERSASLANWIELSRGVIELGPGEEKVVPFVIRANLNATPDMYHAYITFGEGNTREVAEAKPPLATVTVNLELQADLKELLQLNKFTTENVYFAGDDVRLSYQFENIGNQTLAPAGEIVIYDRKGSEVATLEINKEGKSVSPAQMTQFASVWTAAKGYGKFKALLSVRYGSYEKGTLQDTVFFWIIPWKQILAAFIIGIILITIFVFYFHGKISLRRRPGLVEAAPLAAAVPRMSADIARPVSAVSDAPVDAPREGLVKRGVMSVLRGVLWPFTFVMSLFKRKARNPEAARIQTEDTSVRAEIPASAERGGSPAAGDAAPRRASFDEANQGTVIDLKKIRSMDRSKDIEPTDGHVINLKRR